MTALALDRPSPDPLPHPTFGQPSLAPKDGCRCQVCTWTTIATAPSPIRPTDPAWPVLLRLAQAWEDKK